MTHLGAAQRQLLTSVRVARAAWRSPALRRVMLAFLLFCAVEFGTWIAVLLYAYEVTGPASVGVVALVQLVPAALFAPFAASASGRFRRDQVLLGGYLVQALALGATAAGMLLGAPPAVVYVCAAVAVSVITITRPAQGALLPDLARTPEELTAANGLAGTVEGGGVLLGPLAAAIILAFGTPGAVFTAASVACLIAALLVVRLPRPGPAIPAATTPAGAPSVPGVPGGLATMAAGIRALSGSGDARPVIALLGLRRMTSGAMDVMFVLLALEVLGTGESGAGVLNASLGLGMLLGGAASFALVGRRRLAVALAVSATVWGAAIVSVGVVVPAWLAPAVIAFGGAGYAATDVTGRTILQRVTPDHLLSRVLGALEGIGLAGVAAGSLLASLLAAQVGVETALVVVGLLLPVGVAAASPALNRIDRRVMVPEREVALLRTTREFAPLPPPQLEGVARRTRWVTIDPGGVLIREGDHGDRYYVLESGRLRVTQSGRHLRDVEEPGEGLGEIALLHDVRRTATVTALEPCVLLALERADFLEVVTGHEQVHQLVHRVASERVVASPTSTGDDVA